MKADRPLSAPMRRETEETWKQVNDLFRKHGLAEPPVRLRDELVTALEWAWYGQALDQTSEPQTVGTHPDDLAVDRFATAMKAKLAQKREEGRGGWDDPTQCSIHDFWWMLHDHAAKGDPVDIGNFAMMVHQREAMEGLNDG